MNAEFEPMLTTSAQKPYAEYMVGDSGNSEIGNPGENQANQQSNSDAQRQQEIRDALQSEDDDEEYGLTDLDKARLQNQAYKKKHAEEVVIQSPREGLDLCLKKLRDIDKQGKNPTRESDIATAVDQIVAYTRLARRTLIKDSTFPPEKVKEFTDMETKLVEAIEPGAKQNLEYARAIALQFGNELKTYYNLKDLRNPQADYYTTPKNLQDLVERIIDVVSDEYALGGERALLTKSEKSKALEINVDNLTDWIRGRVWFFHDLNSTSKINLLDNISLPTALRPYALIELYGTDSYWQKKKTEMTGPMEEKDWRDRFATQDGKPIYNESGDVLINLSPEKDEDTGELLPARQVWSSELRVKIRPETDDNGILIGGSYVKEGGETYPPYSRLRDDLLYEAYLPDFTHNAGITYRDNMHTEEALNDALKQLYTKPNALTRNRLRMMKILCLGSSDGETHKSKKDNKKSEIQNQVDNNDYRSQGTLGKAIQRLMNAYDYTAEVMMGREVDVENKDGKIEKQKNLFRESLGVKGSEEFYRYVIRHTIKEKYVDTATRYKDIDAKDADFDVAQKLASELDKIFFKQPTETEGGSILRTRKDWEKVDFLDLAILNKSDLLARLKDLSISEAQYNEALSVVKTKLKPEQQKQFDELQFSYKSDKSAQALRAEFVAKFRDTYSVENKKFLDDFVADGDMTKLAQQLATNVWDEKPDSENILNPFSFPKKIGDSTVMIQKAMWAAMSKEMRISLNEARYADMYAFDLAYVFGSAAKNDVAGIGFDAWSKLQNCGRYREGQTEGKNAYGNIFTINGVNKISFTFYEGMKVQKEGEAGRQSTFREILQGGTGDKMDLDHDISIFDFYENSMSQFYADHLSNAFAVFKTLNKIEIAFEKMVSPDPRTGGYAVNTQEFWEFIDKFWKPLRYMLDNHGPDWNAEFRSWTYHQDVQLHGKINRPITATTRNLRELMFGEGVRNMNMYGFEMETGTILEKTGMSRNLLAYIIAKQIQMHRQPANNKKGGIFKNYSVEDIHMIKALFNSMTREVSFNGEQVKVLRDFFTEDEWRTMLMIGVFGNDAELKKKLLLLLFLNSPWLRLYLGEYGLDAGGVLVSSVLNELLGSFLKLIFSELKLG